MENPIRLSEKYERNGWPALARPDIGSSKGVTLPLLTSLERIRAHSLSPDSEKIAFVKDGPSSSDIFLLNLNGGWPGRMTVDRPLSLHWDDEIPQWSPDGNWLAYGFKDHIFVMPISGGTPRRITDFTAYAGDPHWLPDSTRLIVTVDRYDVDQLVITDREGSWPRPLTNDNKGDHWYPQATPDGKSVIYVFRHLDDLDRFDIYSTDIETNETRMLYGKASTKATRPKPSPDGRWIAFLSQETGFDEIWLVTPNGEGLHQLTKSGQDIYQFAWSPDSKVLAVITNHQGAFDLGLVNIDTGEFSILRASQGIHQNPNWTRDGKFITFEYESPLQPADLYKIEPASKQLTQLSFSTPPILEMTRRVHPEIINYKSYDSIEIPAFLYKPESPNGAAILFAHGGPKDQYIFAWDDLAQYFSTKGYHYLAPNFRGSSGYGISFERANYSDWGHGDMQDCLHGAKYLRTLEGIKPDRIGMMGGSYGGYLTINSLARDPDYLFACGISNYGDANLATSWAQCERRLRYYTEIFLGHPAKNLENYYRGSPIRDVRNIQKPILILHGLEDTICPPESSEELVEKLKKENKIFEYKTYAGEPHGFLRRDHQQDAYERIERFFDWYLWPVDISPKG